MLPVRRIRDPHFRAHYPQLYASTRQDWQTRPPNSFRNYDVIEMIPRLRLRPGKTIWFRSFLVVNRRDRAAELATALVDKVDYGLVAFDPATTPWLPVYTRNGRVVAGGDKPVFDLYARPVPGTQPLFLVENAETGREIITTDPITSSRKSRWISACRGHIPPLTTSPTRRATLWTSTQPLETPARLRPAGKAGHGKFCAAVRRPGPGPVPPAGCPSSGCLGAGRPTGKQG